MHTVDNGPAPRQPARRPRSTRATQLLGVALATAGGILLNLGLLVGTSSAQQQPEHYVAPSALLRPSRPLSWLQAPLPPNLEAVVQDKAAAAQLGKAFFWDMQVGSDGVTACATCHFQAGADGRLANTLSPGQPSVATAFQSGGPQATLTAADFPFHKLADPRRPRLHGGARPARCGRLAGCRGALLPGQRRRRRRRPVWQRRRPDLQRAW